MTDAAPERRPVLGRGLAVRIALVGIASAFLAVGIVTLGVWVFGGEQVAQVMMAAGETATHAYAMFDQGVRDVLLVAIVVAFAASLALAQAVLAELENR